MISVIVLLNFRIVVFSSDNSIFTSSIEWTNFALYTIKIQLEMVEIIRPKHYIYIAFIRTQLNGTDYFVLY